MMNGQAASIVYLHNALGQRVFKSEVQVDQTLPNQDELGTGFVNWLRNFKCSVLFAILFCNSHKVPIDEKKALYATVRISVGN